MLNPYGFGWATFEHPEHLAWTYLGDPFTAALSGEKSGTAQSQFTASETHSLSVSRQGVAVAPFVGSGVKGNEVARSGTSTTVFVASGSAGWIWEKTGTAIKEHVADAAARWELAQRNKSLTSGGLGWTFGMAHVASGVNEKNVARTGTARANFVARGREGDGVRGSATSAFAASGYKSGGTYNRTARAIIGPSTFSGMSASSIADVTLNKSGDTVRGLHSDGASAVTYAETGTAVLVRSASGYADRFDGTTNGWTYQRQNAGVLVAVASGDSYPEHAKTGAGVAPFTVRGFAQPAGVAVVQFTGGGTWASVYTNDNFAAREAIDFPTGDPALDGGARSYLLYGATERATNESGEPLTGWNASFTNTLWWEYRVPFTCITRISVIPLDGGGSLDVTGMLNRGTAVNALSDYADPTLHFGEASGRGADAGFASPTSGWSSFPHTTAAAVSFQMDPSTPLVFNAGKRNTLATNVHRHYRVFLERLLPPTNDDPDEPVPLDAAGGVVSWDMAGATGYQGWNWTQLEALMYFGTGPPDAFIQKRLLSGDLFFKLIPEVDSVARVRPLPSVNNITDVTFLVFKGEDPTTWEPVLLNVEEDWPYAAVASNANSYVEFPVIGEQPYVVALLQQRSASFFNDTPFSLGVTTRRTGTLAWEFVQVPTNDDFADRVDLGGASSGTESVADTRGSTAEEDEPEDPWFQTAVGIWYEYAPPTSGWYSWEVDAIALTTPFLTAYRGTDFFDFEHAYDWVLDRPVWMRAGDTYYVRVTAIPDSQADHGNLSWNLVTSAAAANDDFADRIAITLDTGEVDPIDIDGATSEYGEPMMTYQNATQQPSVWYEWTAPYEMDVKFSLGSGWGELGVYTGTSVGALTPVARMSTINDSAVSFHALAGQKYQIQVGYYPSFSYDADPMSLAWEPTTIVGNDTFAEAVEITGTVGSTTVTNGGHLATPEAGTPDLVADFGSDIRLGRVMWFRYVPLLSGTYTFSSIAGNWDGIMAMFRGETLATLELVENALDDTGWGANGFDALLEQGETYYLMVAGIAYPNEDAWDDPANFGFEYDMIPQGEITISWTSANVGDALADASEPLNNLNWFFTYQYGPGEAGLVEQGPYEANGSGACRVASNVGATTEVGEPNHVGVPPERSVWFEWQPGAAGNYDIWVEPAGDTPVLDPRLAIYPFTTSMATIGAVIASNDNFDGLYPRMSVFLNAFVRYLIVVDARDEGTFEINVRRNPTPAPPANDDFADAIVIDPEVGGVINGTTVGATVECGETPPAGFWDGPYGSVWYTFTPTEDGTIFLTFTDPGTHPEFKGTLIDVFQGSDFDDLRNITPADDFSNWAWDEQVGFPVSFEGGIPVYIRFQTENDGADGTVDGDGGPFSFEVLAQSGTPPGNDDFEDGSDAPSAGGSGGDTTHPGTTDGAGYQPGEVDPRGGLLEETEPGGGSVWHTYTPDAPGFIAVYVTRDAPVDYWYIVGVWEGTERETMVKVVTQGGVEPYLPTFGPEYYEVKAGVTYQIQVIRQAGQSWGAYDLHIDEYLETMDWELGPDSFTTLHNGATVASGMLTCSGRQDVLNSREVLPQYGSLDLGATTRKFARQTRIGFEIRVIGGQVLFRHGGDNWSFANAFSDDHDVLFMRRLGLLRVRDVYGDGMIALSLAPGGDGTNYLELNVQDVYIRPYQISFGHGPVQHDSGWLSVEVDLLYNNNQDYDATKMGSTTVLVYVDGKPVFHTSETTELHPLVVNRGQARYIDIGMWRHPTQSPTDEPDYEDPEMWTYQMRNVRVTNVLPTRAFDAVTKGDNCVIDFDGFSPRAAWNKDLQLGGLHPARHVWGTTSAQPFPVQDFPDKDWGGFRSQRPGVAASVTYSHCMSYQRFYCLSMNVPSFPASTTAVSGYPLNGAGALYLDPTGELIIRPYGSREYCVAHLNTNEHYFIEVHLNTEVAYDVRCSVWINGVSFGTFSNKITWSDVQNGVSGIGQSAAPGAPTNINYTFSVGNSGGSQFSAVYDFFFTNLVMGRALPEVDAAIGPLQAVKLAAISGAGIGHNIPDYPGDPEEQMLLLTTTSNDPLHNHSLLYSWEVLEAVDPGPINITKNDIGHERHYVLPYGTQVYHPYYVLKPTTARMEENVGAGNAWSPLGQGLTQVGDGEAVSATAASTTLKLTQFGQSVPHADSVTGIEVRVHRRATGIVNDDLVQLYKGGGLAGTNQGGGLWDTGWEVVTYGGPGDTWGTSWSPNDVNADDFGVAIAVTGSGTAEIDRVSIKVYFTESGPGNHNRWGEQNVVEFYATGDPATSMHAAGFWVPGGLPGGTRGPDKVLSGTPQQLWGSNFPYWGFPGTRTPSVNWLGGAGGATATITDVRIIRDPLVYPRFAWSTNDGASYTWVTSVGEGSSAIAGGDVGDSLDANVIFMDNSATMDRWQHNVTNTPIGSPAYRYIYHYLTYAGQNTGETTIHAANLYMRWRGCNGYPKVARSSGSALNAMVASNQGGVRRVPRYLAANTSSGLEIQRFAMGRDPNGDAWTQDAFNDLLLRVGLHHRTESGAFARSSAQIGAAIYAATWELLVPADADPAPSPCAQLVDLSMSRFASGGDQTEGGTTGVDLSDARYTSGSGDESGGTSGLDLSTTLFASGSAPSEE